VAQGTDEPAAPPLDPYGDADDPRASTALPLSYPAMTKEPFPSAAVAARQRKTEALLRTSAHPRLVAGAGIEPTTFRL